MFVCTVHMCLTVHVYAYAYAPASEYLVLYVGVCHTLYWNTLIFTQNNVCLCCGWMLRTEKNPKDRKRTHKQQKQWMRIQPTKFFKILSLLLNIFLRACAGNRYRQLGITARNLNNETVTFTPRLVHKEKFLWHATNRKSRIRFTLGPDV